MLLCGYPRNNSCTSRHHICVSDSAAIEQTRRFHDTCPNADESRDILGSLYILLCSARRIRVSCAPLCVWPTKAYTPTQACMRYGQYRGGETGINSTRHNAYAFNAPSPWFLARRATYGAVRTGKPAGLLCRRRRRRPGSDIHVMATLCADVHSVSFSW